MSWRKLLTTVLALAVLVTAPTALPAPHHRPPPHRGDRCEQVIQSSAVDLVQGWTIRCANIKLVDTQGNKLRDSYLGLEDPATRTITIQASPMEAPQTPLSILYHELGHAWAEDHLTLAQKRNFAHTLGLEDWNSGSYEERPTEVWARTWQHCFGFPPDYVDITVPCSVIHSVWGAPVPMPEEPPQHRNFYLFLKSDDFLIPHSEDLPEE